MFWPSLPAGRHAVPEIKTTTLRRSYRWLAPLTRRYFRSEVRGMDRIPRSQTIVVTHHDGGVIPVNGICFGVAWHEHFDFERPLYVLTHDVLHGFGERFSNLLAESGLIPADRSAMDAALRTGASVLVFPGAARESFRTFWARRSIDLGGRTGFVAQAIRWGLPITPVVSAGSHETVVVLSGGQSLARALGLRKLVRSADALPLQLGLPWGIWALPFLPPLPLPAKITTEVLDPVWLPDALGRPLRPEDADDPAVLRAGFDAVLRPMRAALHRLYDERRWPVIG